jgi:large conductance mechanosensitive channel
MFKNFFKEFRDFAVKGNAIDMAVGIIIGASFGSIVNSLVKDIIMPPIGLILGNVDFSNLFVVLKEGAGTVAPYASLAAANAAGAVTLNIGLFVNNVISFVIVAFSIFIVIKALNNLKRKQPAPEATTKSCPKCFTTIDIRAVKCPNCTADL